MYLFSGFENTIKSAPVIQPKTQPVLANRIKFAVINIDHPHIFGMTDAIKRGGGELVAVYAKQADLIAAFSKSYPEAKLAKSENEILEDPAVQLVLSSGIPDERAPLGIRVMQHGKDYLTDKPGIITLEQLAEVKKVQQATKRIYSIMYSERFENKATEKASQLVKAGAMVLEKPVCQYAPIGSGIKKDMAAFLQILVHINLISTCILPVLPKQKYWYRRQAMYIILINLYLKILAM
jgi:hypothetical protein